MSEYTSKPIWFCNLARVWDPGEALKKVLNMDGLPPEIQLLTLYIPFPTEKEPLSYIFHWQCKMESISHIPEKHYFSCCVIGLSFYIAKNANKSESLLVISTAIRYTSLLNTVKPVNTDTERTIESVRINGVSVLSGSCCQSQKTPFSRTKYENNKRRH